MGVLEKKTTITDVAKMANVSISTVSHVLNNTATISMPTKRKVWDSIEKLNYKTNALARGLRRSQTKVIGLIVPDIRNEFYAACASGVLQTADQEHYTVFLCDCCYDIEREQRSLDTLIEQRVDGLIFFGGSGDDELIHMAKRSGIPVVLGDRKMTGFGSVSFDNFNSMRNVVNRLYAKGKRKFCYVTEPIEMENLKERFVGFQKGLKDCGVQLDQKMVLIDKCLQKEKTITAENVLCSYLDNPENQVPDVILTSSDIIAIGVLSALHKKGYRIPEDIGVVGFDNIQYSANTYPPLTTVAQDMFCMGQQTFLMLLKLIRGERQKKLQIILRPNYMIRGSV